MSSLIFAFLTAIMAALLGVTIIRRSQINNLRERQLRRGLLQRVEALPLPDVIQAFGINFSRYFYTSPCKRLDECIQLCESCPSSQQCQTQLAKSELSPAEFEFCPARDHLHKHLD